MPITIFHTENGAKEEWLEVREDGTVAHHVENANWWMVRRGLEQRECVLTASEAKARWASYGKKIEEALDELNIPKEV
jgi:hypothetical protein